MALRVSIEVGSRTIAAAFGVQSDGGVAELHSAGLCPTKGFSDGNITDEKQFESVLSELINGVTKGETSGNLQFVLPQELIKVDLAKVKMTGSFFSYEKVVSETEQKCRRIYTCKEGYEILDMIPAGISGNSEAVWRIYTAKSEDIDRWSNFLRRFGFTSITFVPADRAYGTAFNIFHGGRSLIVADIGAESIRVLCFADGMLICSERLPLGADSVDRDIASVFNIDMNRAQKLKLASGEALRYACVAGYVPIPDSDSECNSHDLATVVQSRMEELLEGVIYVVQNAACKDGTKVALIGGGSRLKNTDVLFERLSGLKPVHAKYSGFSCSREELLTIPEYCVAEGALFAETCDREKSGFWDKLRKYL